MKNVVNRNTEIRTYNYDLQNVFNTLIKTLNLTMLITFPSALIWIPAQVRFWKVSSSSNQTSLTPNIKASSNLHPITTTSPHFFSTPLHFLSIPKKIIAPTKNPFNHSSTKHTRLKPNQSPSQSHYTPPFSINTPTQKKGVIIPSPPPHGIRPIIARINRCLNFPRRLQLLHMLTLRTSPWVIGRLPSGLLISRHSYFMTPFSSRGRHHCKRFRDSAIPTPPLPHRDPRNKCLFWWWGFFRRYGMVVGFLLLLFGNGIFCWGWGMFCGYSGKSVWSY